MPTRPDLANLDQYVLRVAHGSLLDNPLDPELGSHVWVATIWPDRQQPGGWGRLVWDRHPSGRGWTIHPLTHLGDVIEFGADQTSTSDRWYGFIIEAGETSLAVVGPNATPVNACDDGARSFRTAAELTPRWFIDVGILTWVSDNVLWSKEFTCRVKV